MSSLNSVLVSGSVLEKPVWHISGDNIPVCAFSIVSKQARRSKEKNTVVIKAGIFPVRASGELARYIKNNISKDRPLRVVGRLEPQTFRDAGNKPRTGLVVFADYVEEQKTPSQSDLNSILIEGVVTNNGESYKAENGPSPRVLRIALDRNVNRNAQPDLFSGYGADPLTVKIYLNGEENRSMEIKTGNTIRAVGSLAQQPQDIVVYSRRLEILQNAGRAGQSAPAPGKRNNSFGISD
jgi:single-stranded DNA-binding protein